MRFLGSCNIGGGGGHLFVLNFDLSKLYLYFGFKPPRKISRIGRSGVKREFADIQTDKSPITLTV